MGRRKWGDKIPLVKGNVNFHGRKSFQSFRLLPSGYGSLLPHTNSIFLFKKVTTNCLYIYMYHGLFFCQAMGKGQSSINYLFNDIYRVFVLFPSPPLQEFFRSYTLRGSLGIVRNDHPHI